MSSRTTTAGSSTQGSATSKPQTSQPSQQVGPMHDKIAMRAYQKWVQRGCPQGTDKQDWLEAEAEVKAEQTRSGAPSAQAQQRR